MTQNTDQHDAPVGTLRFTVTIAWWYMPVLMIQTLKKCGIPVRLWPLFFWQYYLGGRCHG
jgi:hypothetical protein